MKIHSLFLIYIYAIALPAITQKIQSVIPTGINAHSGWETVNPTYSCVIHVSLKYVHTTGKPEDKSRYAQAKENWTSRRHGESMRTRNLCYNSTQSSQTVVWLVQIWRRCAAVAVTYFMSATSEEKLRLDANVEDNPRSCRVVQVGQFANSRYTVIKFTAHW